MESSNTKNGKYLDSLSKDKKSKILKNIASHYRISVAEAEDEVRDDDAEMLYEYIANDQSLKMNVYNDMERGKMAKGGGISKSEKEKLSNIAYQLQNCSDSWISKNHGKFVEMQNEYKKQFKKVYGHTNYADPNTMAKGGNIEFRKLAKSNGFDIIVEEGQFEISVDANGNPKTITNWNAKNPVNISAKNSPIVSKYKSKIMNYIGSDKMAKGGKANEKPLSYYKYETKKVKVAWRGKIQPVGMFYSAEEAMKKIKSMASTESEQKEYSIVTPDKTIHLGESYAIRYAKGGKTASPKPKMVRTQFEEEEFEYGKGGNISEGQMKILNALAGYNNGRNLNGILEGMFLSDFKSNKYATEAQTNTVKKNLNSLIKKGFVEEEGLGYSITQEGANYRRSNMAKGGKTASPKPKMVRTQFEEEEFEYAKGGAFKPYGKTKGRYAIEYFLDETKGQKQREIWLSKEMAIDTARRYSKMSDIKDVKISDENGAEIKYAKGGLLSGFNYSIGGL